MKRSQPSSVQSVAFTVGPISGWASLCSLVAISVSTMQLPKFKPTPRSHQDYLFYLNNGKHIANVRPWQVDSPVEVEPEYWFWLLDTHGIRVNCTDPVLASQIIEAKERANITVKMWAEDLVNGIVSLDELMIWANQPGCIWWMFRAAVNQAQRMALKTIGFVPTFLDPVRQFEALNTKRPPSPVSAYVVGVVECG